MPSVRTPRIIAYQYEAARYCVPCARARFELPPRGGVDQPLQDDNGIEFVAQDSEGNTVSRIYDTDEWWSGDSDYETLDCSNYRVADQAAGHNSYAIAEHEVEATPCPCGDGCDEGECYGCDSSEPDDEEPENEPTDWCSCVSCLAAAAYVPGEAEPEFVSEPLVLALSEPEYAIDAVVATETVFDIRDRLRREREERYPPAVYDGMDLDDGEQWTDDSIEYHLSGDGGPACQVMEPRRFGIPFRFHCERVEGHPGYHGAFGSVRRTGQGQRRVWP